MQHLFLDLLLQILFDGLLAALAKQALVVNHRRCPNGDHRVEDKLRQVAVLIRHLAEKTRDREKNTQQERRGKVVTHPVQKGLLNLARINAGRKLFEMHLYRVHARDHFQLRCLIRAEVWRICAGTWQE